MKTLRYTAAAMAVGLAVILPVRADDDAKKIIAAALKAHGGADKLTKEKDKAVVQKGKMKLFMPIEADGPFETTVTDGKFKREFNFTFMNLDISNTVVFDGKTMWVHTKAGDNVNDMTFDKKEDIDVLKDFIQENGKIMPARITGTKARYQRQLSTAIKRARYLALLPYTDLH